MANKKTIGERLVRLRGAIPQGKVACDIGISSSALGMYEQGRRVPRDEVKVKLSNYYKASIESLFYTP